jgi:hypothetical protein
MLSFGEISKVMLAITFFCSNAVPLLWFDMMHLFFCLRYVLTCFWIVDANVFNYGRLFLHVYYYTQAFPVFIAQSNFYFPLLAYALMYICVTNSALPFCVSEVVAAEVSFFWWRAMLNCPIGSLCRCYFFLSLSHFCCSW